MDIGIRADDGDGNARARDALLEQRRGVVDLRPVSRGKIMKPMLRGVVSAEFRR